MSHVHPAKVQEGKEPLGGRPPAGAKPSVSDLSFQFLSQRAFEAALWAMPALSIYTFRRAAFSQLGMKDNDILAASKPATPKIELLTANSTTPYIAAYTDLRKGPVVVEVPPAGAEGSLYGQVVDSWQMTIADVGPAGVDQGKGGKLLFTPPGHAAKVPGGYIHVPSPNYRVAFAFRSIPAPGKTAADAYLYSQKLRMYYLAEAGNPPPQVFVDPMEERFARYSTLPVYDEHMFRDIHDIVSVEPVREQDKIMMGFLHSLGIEKGKPFAPTAEQTRAMRQAAADAWFFIQNFYDTIPRSHLYWPDRHYMSLMQADANRSFTFVYDGWIDTMARAMQYGCATYLPRKLSETPATEYMISIADKQGEPLAAGAQYRLRVPADMPVKQFWALSVYDRATFAFIYNRLDRTTLSTYDLGTMKKNADGSVDIYIGPTAPPGLEQNWIPTAGKRPLPCMRLYGPTESFNSKAFKLDDLERIG